MLLHAALPNLSFKYDFTRLQRRDQLIDFLGLEERVFEEVLAFDPGAENPRHFTGMKFQRKIGEDTE